MPAVCFVSPSFLPPSFPSFDAHGHLVAKKGLSEANDPALTRPSLPPSLPPSFPRFDVHGHLVAKEGLPEADDPAKHSLAPPSLPPSLPRFLGSTPTGTWSLRRVCLRPTTRPSSPTSRWRRKRPRTRRSTTATTTK